METEVKEKVETLPTGVIVMMLESYKRTNENQQFTIELLITGWVSTVICFAILWCIMSERF